MSTADATDTTTPATAGVSRRQMLPIAGAAGLATALALRGAQPASAATTSSTRVGLPYTVITEPTDAAVQAGIRAWRSDFNGPFPLTRLLFGFSGVAQLTTPLSAAMGSNQIQALRWEGLGKRSTVLRWAGNGPLMEAYGLLRNFLFADFTVQSGRSGAKGFHLRSDSQKTNQDGVFDTIETMGAWDYFYGLDGQTSNSNLNSEIAWRHCAMSNDSSFATAWVWSGMTPGMTQQNQFLNYHFEDTKAEGSHGDYLRFDYGGQIAIDGYGSWIHTGSANGGVPAGRMIYLPRGGNGDSVMHLHMVNQRAELRPDSSGSTRSVFLDSAWSSAGKISMTGIDTAGNSFKTQPGPSIKLRDNADVVVSASHLDGYIGVYGRANPHVVLLGTGTPGSQGTNRSVATSYGGTSKGIVRAIDSGASVSKVTII